MSKILFKLWTTYQKLMWYVAQTGSELGKPLRFYSESALLLLLLDKFGFNLSPTEFILLYIIILVIAMITGYFFASIGTVKYNTSLNNAHNEELQEIIRLLKQKRRI